MIEAAKAKGVYDALETGDMLSALCKSGGHYDLILAVDALIYFGDLSKVFAASAARLSDGGLFAFSVEKGVADYSVQPSLRFAHSADYVARMIKAAGLELTAMEEAVLRTDRGADVTGLLVIARKPKRAASNLPMTGEAGLFDAPASIH